MIELLALLCVGQSVESPHIPDLEAAKLSSPRRPRRSIPTVAQPEFEVPSTPGADDDPVRVQGSYNFDTNAAIGGRGGAAVLGKASVVVDADLERLIGLRGVIAHASAITIHGTGLSSAYIGNISQVSSIEAEPATRLNQAWLEMPVGPLRLRVGKFPATPTFVTSATAAFFVNTTFGWPTSFGSDLPDGGPAWPLSAAGVMATTAAEAPVRFSAAVFTGRPSGQYGNDPQRNDGYGFRTFALRGQPFAIAEVAVTAGAAVFKLGGWRHFDRFDQVRDADRNPDVVFRGNWAGYGVVDLRLTPEGQEGRRLNVFARATLSPADRNLVPFYLDGGLVLTGPSPSRPHDAIGLGWTHVAITRTLAAAPPPRSEDVIELGYLLQLTPALSFHPNVQLVINPVTDAAKAGRRTPTILAPGLRATIVF
jgi:porin